MVEPPPVLESPTPSPPVFTVGWAFMVVLVLVSALFILENIVSIPFIAAGAVASSPSRVVRFEGALNGRASDVQKAKVRTALRQKSPDTSVIFSTEKSRTIVRLSSPVQKGGSRGFEKQFADAATQAGMTVQSPMDHAPRGLSLEAVMAEPIVLIGSGICVQLSILLVWLIAKRSYLKGPAALPPFHQGSVARALMWGVFLALPVSLTANLIDSGMRAVFDLPNDSMWDVVVNFSMGGKVAIVFMGVIGAPICEELFFRGMLVGAFNKVQLPWLGVAVSSILFGLAHFQNVAVIVSITLMGVLLGAIYVKTKSLYASVAVHMLSNAFAFGALLLSN